MDAQSGQQERYRAIVKRLADGASLQTVADEFGITRQRVSQIHIHFTGDRLRSVMAEQNAYRRRNQEIAARRAAGASLGEIAVAFGITRERVRQIAECAGIMTNKQGPSPWIDVRISRLRALWGKLSAAGIGRELGVSKDAVLGKARRLGLHR
jgi:DNA-directed RNA polymerase sigma subunit (sigma70/sigma32)